MEEDFINPSTNYDGAYNRRNSSKLNGRQQIELLDRPLADILPPEFEGSDPSDYFPNFKKDKALRLTRLFASISKPTNLDQQIWWTSKTLKKNRCSSSTAANEEEETSISDESYSYQQNNTSETSIDLSNFLQFGPEPSVEECQRDEFELFCSALGKDYKSPEKTDTSVADEEDESVPPWRFGPAQIWYDRMGLPANPVNFDYGFQLKKKKIKFGDLSKEMQAFNGPCFDESAFLPVNLMNWEENIIFDEETARKRLIRDYSGGKLPRCGWIPTDQTRTYQSFMESWNDGSFLKMFTGGAMGRQKMDVTSDQNMPESSSSSRQYLLDAHHSMFPFDNHELENTDWEEKIIWDADNMPSIPEPTILTLSYEDDPTFFGIPEEVVEDDICHETTKPIIEPKEDQRCTRRSLLILNQLEMSHRQEEEEQMETTIAHQVVADDKDPFNLSNDEYYLPAGGKIPTQNQIGISSLIQHSLPAQNLHSVLFPHPHHMKVFNLRHFHRMPIPERSLKRLTTREAPIHSLTRHIRITKEQKERQESVEGCATEMFSMRDLKDLTGRDGKLVLFEYSEEFPPYLNQPGMASKIRNYHKRTSERFTKESDGEFEYGEHVFSQNTPFLGSLAPGQRIQALENKMFRSPIYRHNPANCDFLLIHNNLGIFIRPFNALFIAGQECPIEAIPAPNSKQSANFKNNFLLAYVYRLFWKSEDDPRIVRMDDIRFAFPSSLYPDAVLKKLLKHCADLKKPMFDQSQFVLHDDFLLPSKLEIQNMATPESYCAYMSMAAAEQRLKDAGYDDKCFYTTENKEDEEQQATMDDEIKCAAWNTTKAFIDAQHGKCFFDHQNGSADPTGCGLGFSYVSAKIPKVTSIPKKLVAGTEADLRTLKKEEVKEYCRQIGMSEEKINSITHWERREVIRAFANDRAKGKSGKFPSLQRFARGGGCRASKLAEMQEEHKAYCQRIFDLQNENLASDKPPKVKYMLGSEVSSTPHRKNSIPSTNEDSRQILGEFEREEQERLELQKMIHGVVSSKSDGSRISKKAPAENFFRDDPNGFSFPDPNFQPNWNDHPKRKLKINRTFFDKNGNEIVQTEVISHPQLIEAYIRIRSTRDDDFICAYAGQDVDYSEETQQKRLSGEIVQETFAVPVKTKAKKLVTCSVCGEIGHMKSNRNCPFFGKKAPPKRIESSLGVSSKEQQRRLESEEPPEEEGLVCSAMEGTKLKISKVKIGQMHQHSGRLISADLALSESDDEDEEEEFQSAKRSKLDE